MIFGERLLFLIWKLDNYSRLNRNEFRLYLKQRELFLKNTINRDRFRFLIYMLYFLFLIITSFINLEGYELSIMDSIYKPISYSFITFIAFDRILANKQIMKIDFKSFIRTLDRFNNPFSFKKTNQD
ncbi:MAG: hypothetical protein M9916_00410 [Crocinitomicaceae bacterium]|nr:hypothetical protein [Crocinitomicaceae bacterium]